MLLANPFAKTKGDPLISQMIRTSESKFVERSEENVLSSQQITPQNADSFSSPERQPIARRIFAKWNAFQKFRSISFHWGSGESVFPHKIRTPSPGPGERMSSNHFLGKSNLSPNFSSSL